MLNQTRCCWACCIIWRRSLSLHTSFLGDSLPHSVLLIFLNSIHWVSRGILVAIMASLDQIHLRISTNSARAACSCSLCLLSSPEWGHNMTFKVRGYVHGCVQHDSGGILLEHPTGAHARTLASCLLHLLRSLCCPSHDSVVLLSSVLHRQAQLS